MAEEEPMIEYSPADDERSGSPLVDALNKFARTFPELHSPAEVAAFMKSIEGLPDAPERYERFVQEIAARYEKWARENGQEPN